MGMHRMLEATKELMLVFLNFGGIHQCTHGAFCFGSLLFSHFFLNVIGLFIVSIFM